MVEKKKGSKSERNPRFRLSFENRQKDDPEPEVSVVALDARGRKLESVKVAGDGSVALEAATLEKAETVLVGPRDADFAKEKERFTPFHGHQIRDAVERRADVSLTRRAWLPFLQIKLCVAGKARHCHWHPWWTEIYNLRVTAAAAQRSLDLGTRQVATLENLVLEPLIPGWKHCRPLCDGVVEVYRRTCCCPPIIVFDPRIPEIIDRLEKLVVELPPGPPIPDPPPFEKVPFQKSGAADLRAIQAEADLRAVKSLSGRELVEYVNARPYLFCHCSAPEQVASGFLQPDGSFNICWWEPLRIMFPGCRDRVAYKVKQVVDGVTVTVYDGVAAHQWFGYDDDVVLTTYHPDAVVCDEPPDPPAGVGKTSVMLELIGSTESRHLDSPVPDGWSSVGAPGANGGLAFPAAPPADPSTPQYKNVGWGGTLALRYLHYEDLRPIATYFRVSVARANAAGDPVGTRTYLDHPLAWVWYRRRVDGTIVREVEPLKDGGYYKIPYESLFQAHLGPGENGKWGARQVHAFVDTTKFADDKHLVTLELYDSAKNQIQPQAANDPGAQKKDFTFQSWNQADLSATEPVSHKGLTHLFWWDNRDTTAEIVGIPGVGDCQFLTGPRNATVEMSYKAYHEEPKFLYRHDVRHQKGLHGGWQNWVPWNADNHKVPAGVTPAKSYEDMLGTADQCTFGVEVRTQAKITDGSGRITDYDHRDNGSFAIVSPKP